MQGKGLKLDVMDYIYNELWSFVMEKKLPPYAPFLMKLIEDTWFAAHGVPLEHPIPLTVHEVKKLKVKSHAEPRDEQLVVEEEKTPSWVKKLARRMKQTFCLQVDIHKRQYEQHVNEKNTRKLNKAIARQLGLEVSPPGTEENITPEGEWRS